MRFLGFLMLALPLCAATPRAANILDQTPARFEQGSGANRFVVRGLAYDVQVRDRETRLQVRGKSGAVHPIRMTLAGSKSAAVKGVDPLAAKTSIFKGKQSAWRTNLANFAKVERPGVYPGIDLVYYGAGKQLEYDFVVAPNADPSRIAMRFGGAKSRLDREGQLILEAGDAEVIHHVPAIYQINEAGNPVNVEGGYKIASNGSVGFHVGAYDRSRPLIIDPVVGYTAYFGSTYADGIVSIGTDSIGALYILGYTNSTDLPVPEDTTQSINKGLQDMFVARVKDGQVTFYTYLGGSNQDEPKAMSVGLSGNVYITGTTLSLDFPVTASAYQSTLSGSKSDGTNLGTSDAFLARIDPSSGSLAYSSYLGGLKDEIGYAVAAAPNGIAYVTGVTNSDSYPINSNNAFQGANAGGYDMFVAKFDTTKSGADSLPGSSYLGGSNQDAGRAIAVDPTGGVWVAGVTDSGDFPIFGESYRFAYAGNSDAVLIKLNPDLSGIAYTSFFGGSDIDEAHKVAVDTKGRVYFAGVTLSTDIPVTANALQKVTNGNGDIFLAVLDPSLPRAQQITYSTYFGGSDADSPYDLALDPATGFVHLAGYTISRNFPTTADAVQKASAKGGVDGFVATINPAKAGIDGLVFASYVTSTGSQLATSLALAPDGTLYVAGATSGSLFPDGQAQRTTPRGSVDGFVMALQPENGSGGVASPTGSARPSSSAGGRN
ncbi:MAG: SBBP repeat-containing protein [Bryobacteraceae bacterium]